MTQDYLAVLQSLKEEIKDDSDYKIDSILVQEEVGPKLSEGSKSFKENKKVIFRQEISSDNAKELGTLVLNVNEYSIENLMEYKNKINNKCGIISALGESPVEMLIYATKGLENNSIHKNAIRDILKNLYLTDKEFVIDGYRNILTNWTWYDCVELVLDSIKELSIIELTSCVYNFIEKNKQIREKACKTLFSLEAEDYYDSLFNFLTSQNNESREEIEIFRELVIYFSGLNEKNSAILYKNYMVLNLRAELANIVIAGIRKNLNSNILNHAERTLINPNLEVYKQNKIIRLLNRCARNEKVMELLIRLKGYNHLNQINIDNAIGGNDINLQIQIAKDKTKNERNRLNALIHLGGVNKDSEEDNSEIDEILRAVGKETDILKVASASALVERGFKKEIVTLFSEIVKRDEDDEVAREAVNQIRRLRGTNGGRLNDDLIIVATKLLAADDANSKNRVLKILDLFTTGLPSDKVGLMFLDKLNKTHHGTVKVKILTYYSKNFNKFDPRLKAEIKRSIVKCSKENGVSNEAMNCLKIINSFVDDTPMLKGM